VNPWESRHEWDSLILFNINWLMQIHIKKYLAYCLLFYNRDIYMDANEYKTIQAYELITMYFKKF